MKRFLTISILGILSALLATILEQFAALLLQIFSGQEVVLDSYSGLTTFLILAVIIEEGLKYFLIQFALRDKFSLEGKKLIAGSLCLGLFFGLAEIGLTLTSNPIVASQFRAFDRQIIFELLSIVLLQTSTSLMIASLIATQAKPRPFFAWILFFPVIIHLLYNFLVIQKSNYTNMLLLALLIVSFLVSLSVLFFNRKKLD